MYKRRVYAEFLAAARAAAAEQAPEHKMALSQKFDTARLVADTTLRPVIRDVSTEPPRNS